MNCEIMAEGIEFQIGYTVNGGSGYYSDPNDDEIEVESVKVYGSSQDLMDVIDIYCLRKIEKELRYYHEKDREDKDE